MSSNQDSCVVITTSDYNIFSSDYDYELLNQLENTDFKLNDLNIRNLSRTLITDSKGITGIGNLEDVKRIFGSNTDVSMNIIVSGKYLSGESPPPVSTGNSFTDIANNIKYTTLKQIWDNGIRKLFILKNKIDNPKVVDLSGNSNVVYMLDFKTLQNQNTFNNSITIYSGPISDIPSKIYLTNVVSKTLPEPWTNVNLEDFQIKITYDINLSLDFTEMIREIIILNLPIAPKCDINCQVQERENKKTIDPRLAVLAKLKNKTEDCNGCTKEEDN